MTSACGAGSTACVTEAATAPTQVEKKKNQNVGYGAEMKYIYIYINMKKRKFGTFRENSGDSNGGRGGGGPRDDESALKVKLDSLWVVMGEG